MFNFFKDFFGSSGSNDSHKNFNKREDFLKEEDDDFSSKGFFKDQDDQMGFNVFTNPLEMHRYFESQLNNMLKSFGIHSEDMFGFDENSHGSFSNFLEGPKEQPTTSDDLRNQYLKPGFQQPHSKIKERSDSDLDGKINTADLDLMFSGKNQEVKPHEEKSRMQTFGRKIVTKMFTSHNGIIESRQVIKDNEGNEETIVTHKRGDQEYTKITKINKDGKEEIKENFVNMTEEDLPNFLNNTNMIPDSSSISEKKHPNWFPFNKYFK